MGSIRRIDPNYNPIGRITSSITPDAPEKKWCEACMKIAMLGLQPLGPRVNYNAEDKDNWLQCYSCGRVYATHELKIEGKLSDVAETYDNPFSFKDAKIHGIGGDRKFDSTGKSRYTKQQKFKEQFSDIKDEDLKRELRKGAKLISYSEKL